MAAEVPDGGLIVELGVWKGMSLAYLAQKITERKKRVRLVGIDNFRAYGCAEYARLAALDSESQYTQCRENLDECGFSWVQLMIYDSIAAAELFSDSSINFLFIDDLHEPDHVERELRAWLPKLKAPTWIAGDDCTLVEKGVRRVFPEICQELGCWIARIK